MFPGWSWILGLMIGASFGSFLNVVIYRMPLGLSLSNPKHSFCPNCQHQLHTIDLIPLFSWLFLGGKCHYCKVPVPPRYFIVEVITGSLFAAYWYEFLIRGFDPAQCLVLCAMSACLVAAFFIDLRWFIIPDQVNAALLFFGFAMNLWLFSQHRPEAWTWGIPSSLAGAWAGALTIWGIAFLGRLAFGKDAMGHGDIKLVRGIGAILLPFAMWVSVAMAVFLGAIVPVAILLFQKLRGRPKGSADEAQEPDEEEIYVPESIGSLLKCGLGYLLFLDVIGLFYTPLYERYFGENPYAAESAEDDGFVPTATMIPFGPYLAVGGIVVSLFKAPIIGWIVRYWEEKTAFGG